MKKLNSPAIKYDAYTSVYTEVIASRFKRYCCKCSSLNWNWNTECFNCGADLKSK